MLLLFIGGIATVSIFVCLLGKYNSEDGNRSIALPFYGEIATVYIYLYFEVNVVSVLSFVLDKITRAFEFCGRQNHTIT